MMQCPDCKQYRHDGPCKDEYDIAWAEYQSYMEKHPPAHRTTEQFRELYRLEGVASVLQLKRLHGNESR